MKDLTNELLDRFRAEVSSHPEISVLGGAMARTDLKQLAYLPMQAAKLNGAFDIVVNTHGVTAQEKSGRCWMFAAMNILREKAAQSMNVEDFRLSGNYLEFYDKLEKANNLMEMAIDHAMESLDERMNEYILGGFGDGGYWSMAADLVRKYGAVPEKVMPETYQSSHTESFREMLMHLMRKDVALLREAVHAGDDAQARKDEMLSEVYRYLCIAFGEPVRIFNYSWRDKDGIYHETGPVTPQEFYRKYIGRNLEDYIVVSNYPTQHRPLDCVYHFHYIGSASDGEVTYLNLPMEEVEQLCIRQLRLGEPVWFGCDSRAYGARKEGVWDIDSFCYEQLMGGADIFMDKKTRLEMHDSDATHAMILTGVHLSQTGKPDRWRIENSWGDQVGDKGYFVCSEHYFTEYVYEAVIRRDLLDERQKKILAGEPIRIQPWQI